MAQFSASQHGPVPREHFLRVLRLFATVKELPNRWIEIKKWGVIREQVYFQDEVIKSVVLRFADRLGIPAYLFWEPDKLADYISNAPTAPHPQWKPDPDEPGDK